MEATTWRVVIGRRGRTMSKADVVRIVAGLGLLFAGSGLIIILTSGSLASSSSFPWVALSPSALPWLLLLLGFAGLLLLRRWGGVVVCAIGWYWVAILLLGVVLYGLSDSEIPLNRDTPFLAVIATTLGTTVILTALVSFNWRQLKGGI
jgi:hypothetical protein